MLFAALAVHVIKHPSDIDPSGPVVEALDVLLTVQLADPAMSFGDTNQLITGLYPRIRTAPDGTLYILPSSLNPQAAVARVNVGVPLPFCSAILPRKGQ
jgi:hypothetical protein